MGSVVTLLLWPQRDRSHGQRKQVCNSPALSKSWGSSESLFSALGQSTVLVFPSLEAPCDLIDSVWGVFISLLCPFRSREPQRAGLNSLCFFWPGQPGFSVARERQVRSQA